MKLRSFAFLSTNDNWVAQFTQLKNPLEIFEIWPFQSNNGK